MATTPTSRTSDSQPKHHERSDGADAFLRDPAGGPARAKEELAENLAEGFLMAATSAEEPDHDEMSVEEMGGPFVESTGEEEFAEGTDEANPEDAEAEAFPTTHQA